MKTIIIGAGSDLGVHIDGSKLGPVKLLNDLKGFHKGESTAIFQEDDIIKSRNLSDRRKNQYELDEFNKKLYQLILEKTNDKEFPIVLGGDASISMASTFADQALHENIGLIYIGAHPNYHTFKSTVTGNIEGISLSTINGYKKSDLGYYHTGNIIQSARTYLIGGRGIIKEEAENIRYSGVNFISTEELLQKNINEIIENAFTEASYRTKGVHIIYNIDIVDPEFAPGVSIPEFEGITPEKALEINEAILKHVDILTGYDLVGFNPLRDANRKTEQILVNLLAQVITKVESYNVYKGKY